MNSIPGAFAGTLLAGKVLASHQRAAPQGREPAKITRALMAVVHEGVSANALTLLEEIS